MAQQPNQNPFQNFTQGFPQMQMPTFDMQAFSTAFSSIGKRNAEAFSSAAQTMAESAQTIARRSMENMRETMEHALVTTRDLFTGSSPELNLSRQAEFANDRMKSNMTNLREISDMATKSGFEAAQTLQQRMSDSVSEIQKVAATAK